MLRFTVVSCMMLGAARAAPRIAERALDGSLCPSPSTMAVHQPTSVISPSPFCQCDAMYPTEPGTQPIATVAAQNNVDGDATPQTEHKEGHMTYFDLGLGACGMDDSGKDDVENIVALSHHLMGEKSNDNPFCGRTITIRLGDKSATAVVRDKCMGCAMEDVDVSKVVFKELAGSLEDGRLTVEWWFN